MIRRLTGCRPVLRRPTGRRAVMSRLTGRAVLQRLTSCGPVLRRPADSRAAGRVEVIGSVPGACPATRRRGGHGRGPRGDDGTILVLLLGFVAVLVLMVAVVVNVSAVVLAKRGVASAADGAAVSAAQALDLPALYGRGLAGGAVPLDPGLAAARVAEYEAGARAGQPGLELVLARVDGGSTAVVQAVRLVDLPFGRLLGFQPVRVEAEAQARAPVLP